MLLFLFCVVGEPRETGAGTPVRLAKIQRAEDVQDKDIGPGAGAGVGVGDSNSESRGKYNCQD